VQPQRRDDDETGRRVTAPDVLRASHSIAHYSRPSVAGEYLAYKRRLLAQRLGGRRASLHFAPQQPREAYVIWKVAHHLGLRIVPAWQPHTVASVLWHDDTVIPPMVERASSNLINGRCLDISKRRVDEAMAVVLGYRLAIDPTVASGVCVRKSDANGTHDGELVRCPVAAPDGRSVYQRLVANTVSDSEVEDLRAVVVGATVPLVYVKHRPLRSRFSNTNSEVRLAGADAVFDESETRQLIDVAAELSLDLGELDVLRDREDGRIYVVDVSNTPSGPPNHLPRPDRSRAVELISSAVERQLLGPGRAC